MPKGIYKHKKYTIKQKKEISKRLMGNKHCVGRIPWNKGKKISDKYKKKISKGRKGKYKGEKHWNWKGGKTKIYKHTDTQTLRYKQWRIKVFERDDWTCQTCGAKSKVGEPIYLIPHHKKGWTKYPKLRYKISNGITLCQECHILLHKLNHNQYKNAT